MTRERTPEYYESLLSRAKGYLPEHLWRDIFHMARAQAGGKVASRKRREAAEAAAEEHEETPEEEIADA